jgi:hypothetical protein
MDTPLRSEATIGRLLFGVAGLSEVQKFVLLSASSTSRDI